MSPQKIPSLKGIYEVGIGVPDLETAIAYWQQFGYRVGAAGQLEAETAQALYQANSPLSSVRLFHQEADHGLIRLMQWAQPSNQGLGLSSMKARGNRWATTLTASTLR